MRTPSNILKHELIGLQVKVVESKVKSQVGFEGKIVDETRDTLLISTRRGEKKVLKRDVKIQTKVADEAIKITGKNLVGKPEDRLKK